MQSDTIARRLTLLAWYMLSIVVLSREFVVKARAWSLNPRIHTRTHPVVSSSRQRLHRVRDSSVTTIFPGTTLTAAAAAADTNSNDNDEEKEKTPATGWQHNQPSESSNFWKKTSERTNGLRRVAQQSQARRGGDGSSEEPLTGWLHNKEPKKKSDKTTTTTLDSTSSLGSGVSSSSAQRLLIQAKMKKDLNHRIVAPPAFHACGDNRQVVVTEHLISLPVFRSSRPEDSSNSRRMDIFFSITECVKKNDDDDDDERNFWQSLTNMSPQERAQSYVQHAAMTTADNMLLYLQGGPGFGSPTPMVGLTMTKSGSWAGAALDHYKRIVLMDQRGTGRSSPVTKQTLEKLFPDLFLLDTLDESQSKVIGDFGDDDGESKRASETLTKATNFMAQLRADNIVKDAEAIKDALMLPPSDENEETQSRPRPWGAALGQSFGGFCMMTYLSLVEHPPRICLLTGGIAPMLTPAYEAYCSLWQRVKERNLRYYEMYPGDISAVKCIVKALLGEPVILPSGGMLTARRFLNLGLGLGGSPSAFASLHEMISTACVERDDDKVEFTRAFLKRIDSAQSFDDHPLYFLMHESIYGDGPENSPTNWAASRAYESLIKTPSEFDYRLTCTLNSDERPTLFFGEMVFPWMANGDFAEVSGVGMRSLADALAKKEDWAPLYDDHHMRSVLQDGRSRAAAAVYFDDMYVDFDASMKVAKQGTGPLQNCKVWVTNEFQHSGLRDDGANIFSKLHGMATGSIRTPS